MSAILIPLCASTLLVTSALLFVLEPLVGKSLLPVAGGGAAVWTTAVAFFQLALLAGYAYAHIGPSWLTPRRHAAIHVFLLACVAVALPLPAPSNWVAPAEREAIWLFGRLAVSIGPCFVLLAATAPLVQRWLASTRHREARDPYFLYAASNAGSLLALLAYPVVIEPLFGLEEQRHTWRFGLWFAVVLVGACATLTLRTPPPAADSRADPPAPAAALPPRIRWRWLVLAAIPSSLLLSVTSYVTTDVVALPLLWIVPLALYLLTFIIAFARRAIVPSHRVLRVQAFLLVPVAAEMFLHTQAAAPVLVPLHALTFFVTALACHQALAASRPTGPRSTEFYLIVAAGGALGGLCNVFLAPVVFRGLYEYPLALVAVALLRPPGDAVSDERRARRLDLALPLALGAVLLLGTRGLRAVEATAGAKSGFVLLVVLLSAVGTAGYAFRARPLRFALVLAAIIGAGATYAKGSTRTLFAGRSFYGVHKVVLETPTTRTLWHGNTRHGSQDMAPERRGEPLTYYHRTGPMGGVMTAWQGRPQRRRVGVVGLGAGSLAAYAAPGEHWTFFEIDEAVIDIARDRGLFSFLGDARGKVDVVLGDARLSIAAAPDGAFGVLVLDAFSSDAVPAHLLTREAIALYLRKLGPGGLIAVHLSNRMLDLEPVVAGGAAAVGCSGLVRFDNPTEAEARASKTASHWMVLARSPADLAPLATDARWVPPRRNGPGWTDDAFNLWRALRL